MTNINSSLPLLVVLAFLIGFIGFRLNHRSRKPFTAKRDSNEQSMYRFISCAYIIGFVFAMAETHVSRTQWTFFTPISYGMAGIALSYLFTFNTRISNVYYAIVQGQGETVSLYAYSEYAFRRKVKKIDAADTVLSRGLICDWVDLTLLNESFGFGDYLQLTPEQQVLLYQLKTDPAKAMCRHDDAKKMRPVGFYDADPDIHF